MAGLNFGVAGALLGFLLLGAARLPPGAGASEIGLRPGSGITLVIQPRTPALPGKSCYILTSRRRDTTLTIRSGERVAFTFSCQNPESHFVMEIRKSVDCVSGPCPFGEVQLEPSTSVLPALNRTFIWDIKAHKSIGLELHFSRPRLRQIGPGEACPDGVTHSISGHINTAEVKIGTFCSNGTVSRIKMQEGVKVALHLPWFHPRNFSGFSFANHTAIKRLCIIECMFEGEGTATLMSANYPEGFPEDELMTWQFLVPPHLRSSVSFLSFNVSNCAKKEERVEYYIPGSTTNPEVFKLGDQQPGNMAGTFNLSLQGCDQDAQSPGILRLRFQVLVQHPQTESNKTYVVDLSNEQTMSLTIEPRPVKHGRKFVPGCFVCLESRTCSANVTLTSGSKHRISFLCDNLTRLWMNAEKTLSCLDPRYCQRKSYHLQVPSNILQLPVQLHDFSWKLLVPKDRLSLALVPAQKLQQHTHERACSSSFSYLLASAVPGQDLYFGSFCPGGAIQQIQVKQNVSVTLRTFSPGFQQNASRQVLNVSFIPFFKEESIFTVTPDAKSKVYLRTPNWDRGLPSLSSVSWNISVPSNQVACLTFVKERMGMVCQTGRAFMIIQEQQTRAEEVFSLEEALPEPRVHRRSFWVNVSNCSPASGKQLDLLFWVTLTPRTMDLTTVISAAVVGGAFLLLALGLIICFVKRKKRRNKGPAVGIYNGNANTQMPRLPKLFQERKDDDAHVYAVIDDTMVYGHLLQDASGSFLQPEVDTYRPFQGLMGDCPPSTPAVCSRTPNSKLASDYSPSPVPSESEGEPYTFSQPTKEAAGSGHPDIPLLHTQGPTEPME